MAGRWDSPDIDQSALERLWREGYGALAEGRMDDALGAAAALEELGSSTAFELRGHVQLTAGRPDLAVLALREGVGRAQDNWVLRQLLGAAYSEAGELERAEEAFLEARGIDGADPVSVDLNRATLAARRGDTAGARALLDAHGDAGPYAQRYGHLRAELFLEEGDDAGALAAAKLALDGASPDQDDVRGALLATAATALAGMNRRNEARAAALAALEIERGHPEALAVIRGLDAGDPAGCRWWHVMAEGRWPARPGVPAQGFLTAYVGVAASPEALVAMGAALEPEPLRQGLRLTESAPHEGEAGAAPGVYGMGGHSFFPLDGPG